VSIFPHVVDSRYIETMKIPLLAGRNLAIDDDRDSEQVVLINDLAAKTIFPGQDPLGQIILSGSGEHLVVGVVGDLRHQSLELGSGFQVYFPYKQMGDFSTLEMVVRSPLPAATIAPAVSAALKELDPAMPTQDFWTLTATVDQAVSARRFALSLLGAFAGVALLLAGLGIYGVLSYSVTERVPEIGVRMALGASAQDVRQQVVGRTLILTLVGIAIGGMVSVVGTRLLGALLFGVEPTDPATFVAVATILVLVATISGLIPAIRASRTDSAAAMRVG
jgi:ABC-type antimicrobial peptide transport system permease subunit